MDYLLTVGILVGFAASLAISLNVASGHSRSLSLAHAAFWGLGAYGYALTTLRCGWHPAVGLGAGVLAAVGGGLIVGVPALRLRGDYFLIATLGLGEVLNVALVNLDRWTGGSNGLSGIPLLTGIPKGPAINRYFCGIALGMALVMALWGSWVQRSPFGQALRATAEDEGATQALGRNTTALKLQALVLGAGMAGLVGGVYASWTSFISPEIFQTSASLLLLTMILLGGLGNVWGAVLGAVVLTTLPEGLRFAGLSGPNAQLWQQLIYGVLLIIIMALRPSGLIPVRLGQ